MRNKNYQSVFFLIGIFLHAIYLYGGMKIFWFIGCACVIISLFLPGVFFNLNCQKSTKEQEGKKNNLQETKNCTSDSIEKNSEQDNFPPS